MQTWKHPIRTHEVQIRASLIIVECKITRHASHHARRIAPLWFSVPLCGKTVGLRGGEAAHACSWARSFLGRVFRRQRMIQNVY